MSTLTVLATMRAIRVQPSPDPNKPHSVTNPATSSSLGLDNVQTPHPKASDEILVHVKASTIIRDTLTWPEMYEHPHAIPGHDFAGVVVETFAPTGADASDASENKGESKFKHGDEVYGMVHADRGGCWAEYVVVKTSECALKPAQLSWEQAASIPLSALTAWQALFKHGNIKVPPNDLSLSHGSALTTAQKPRVFITGATGGVGVWLVQLAKLAHCHVVGGTTSKSRSEDFLKNLGVDEIYEYTDHTFAQTLLQSFDTIIDTVGGTPLEQCWSLVKPDGSLVSIDSASFDFIKTYRESGVGRDKTQNVKAKWFIVEPSADDLGRISQAIETGHLATFVAEKYPLDQAVQAYDRCHANSGGRGKIILAV